MVKSICETRNVNDVRMYVWLIFPSLKKIYFRSKKKTKKTVILEL